jgi:hypothetical protein
MKAAAPTPPRGWIAVASAEHVQMGRAHGFMQVCHGKAAPLRRLRPGDGVVYYSPTTTFGGRDQLQAFTAIGQVAEGEPYQADMGGGFCPYRRSVAWWAATPAPIRSLLPMLSFSAGKSNWAYPLRFGLFEITPGDLQLIQAAMAQTGRDAGPAAGSSAPCPLHCAAGRPRQTPLSAP